MRTIQAKPNYLYMTNKLEKIKKQKLKEIKQNKRLHIITIFEKISFKFNFESSYGCD